MKSGAPAGTSWPAPAAPTLGRWLGPMCALTALALLGYGLVIWRQGASQVGAALLHIGAAPVVWALGLVLLTLVLRVVRWQTILRGMGHRLPWRLQARVYWAGLALSATPGKLGETSRAALLLPSGVPVAHTLGAFLCDRLADVVAVAGLGVAAAALIGQRQAALEVVLLVCVPGAAAFAWFWRAKASPGRRWLSWLRAPLCAWSTAWLRPQVFLYVLVAVLVYGMQALVFAMFVERLHPGLDWAASVLVFCSSTLIGAASLVPGGLGTMDAALVWQLRNLGVAPDAALAATLATRVCTLWFAWTVGVSALVTFARARSHD